MSTQQEGFRLNPEIGAVLMPIANAFLTAAVRVQKAVEHPSFLAGLQKVADGVEIVERRGKASGIDKLLVTKTGMSDFEAAVYAGVMVSCAYRLRNEKLSAKRLASSLWTLKNMTDATTLVISRQARKVAGLLESRDFEMAVLDRRLRVIGHPDREVFESLLRRAEAREAEACRELVRLAAELATDPRGRRPKVGQGMDDLIREDLKERGIKVLPTYSDDPGREDFKGDYTDDVTTVVRKAAGQPRFSPRRRKLRA